MKKICLISLCFALLLNLTCGFRAEAKQNIDINAKGVVLLSCAEEIKQK